MTDVVSIQLGVPEHGHAPAARLFCQAFERKLSPFLGTTDRAAPFLATGLIEDRAFVALKNDQVVGIAGFKLAGKGLFEPAIGGFFRTYGLSAPLRILGLALLERKETPEDLLMDGIAVAEGARGLGIGSRLLHAVENHARDLRRKTVRLDVVDTNPRARRLYERNGYVAGKSVDIGPLSKLLGFRTSTTMQKTVAA